MTNDGEISAGGDTLHYRKYDLALYSSFPSPPPFPRIQTDRKTSLLSSGLHAVRRRLMLGLPGFIFQNLLFWTPHLSRNIFRSIHCQEVQTI